MTSTTDAAPSGRGTARERVVATLRAEIVAGRLAPGVPLRTEAVTERLGVSSSPLREAFVQLAAEGLVEVHPNRGVVVAPVTRDGAADVIRIGSLLWDAGARWIVPVLEPATVTELKRADVEFGLALRSGDLASAILDGEQFQEILLASCWSTELVRAIEAVRPRLHRLVRLLASYPVLERQGAVQTAILDAAGSTDVEPVIAAFHSMWATLTTTLDTDPVVTP